MTDDRSTSVAGDPAIAEELLIEQLQDLLHAEGQLVKALTAKKPRSKQK